MIIALRRQVCGHARVVNFYKSYRACVRARVAVLAAEQALETEQAASSVRRMALARAEDYLRLAGAYTTRLGPPTAIIVSGLMGSGKSTLAEGRRVG